MAAHDVEVLHFCARVHECPSGPRPDIALSGRSNVGKSSLINMLLGRRKLARTSKDPGRTRCLIYYLVESRWHLVDMPGYGYARVSREERRRWFSQAKEYFQRREQLRAVVQLIDMKVGPTADDRARVRELVAVGRPLCLVFTKADATLLEGGREWPLFCNRWAGGAVEPAGHVQRRLRLERRDE